MNKQTRWIGLFLTFILVAGLACQTLAGDDESAESEEQLSSSNASEDADVLEEPADETSEPADETPEPLDESIGADDSSPDAPPVIEEAAGDEGEDRDPDAVDDQFLTLNQNNNFGVPTDAESYRIAFSMEISFIDGSLQSQVMHIVGEKAVSNDPPASSFNIQVSGVEVVYFRTDMSIVRIEDTNYIIDLLGDCTKKEFGIHIIEFNEFTDGAHFVGVVSDANLVERNLEINGVNTDHYSFSQSDLDGSGAINESIENFQGDLYLSDEGYLVRIAISGESSGRIGFLTATGEGSVKY